jgi:hypothetical protein
MVNCYDSGLVGRVDSDYNDLFFPKHVNVLRGRQPVSGRGNDQPGMWDCTTCLDMARLVKCANHTY